MYPAPNALTLGTHAVLSLDGRVRFGPDADHLPDRALDYRVDESKRAAFGASVRRLLPTSAPAIADRVSALLGE